MTSILATRAARRRGIVFVVLLTITVLLMALSSNPFVREVQNGVSFAFRPIQVGIDDVAKTISSVAGTVAEIDRLRIDNAALQAENDRLTAENARLNEIARENDNLTALLQLRAGFDYQTVAANVIARESSEFRKSIVIDRGTDQGLKVGDVAVAAGGALAGRVTDVTNGTARILLLTDTQSTVIGQLSTNAATGEVVGQLGGVLIMDQIDVTETVTVGDEVVTAGIELASGVRSPYPKGLLIGQVVDVKHDANAVVQTAYLQPAARLDKLETLLVITDYQGGLPPIEDQPIDWSGKTLPAGEQPCASTPAATARTATPAPTRRP